MSIRIYAPDPAQAIPRDVVAQWRCDGLSLLCAPPATFAANWYPDAASAAVRAGWTLTAERQLGPCCSGKRTLG